MRKVCVAALSAIVTVLLAVTTVVALPSSAQAATASGKDRFARETSRPGDQDTSASDIEHVYELQHRLKRTGHFDERPTGYYGSVTRVAVKRFQRDVELNPTGVANHRTWAQLLRRSNRDLGRARNRCGTTGWRVCYDRQHHQATLWRHGRLWNSWLVRGGAWEYKTRRGVNPVYWRDRDHVSGLYGSPMPFSQFFDGGQALHGSGLMVDPWVGHSHGCINMYVEDARQLWRLTARKRLVVHVYGKWD